MRFKIDRASLIVGSKFTVFAWFYFVFEGNFQVQAPGEGGGAYIWRTDLTEGFLRYEFRGLIHGGAYFQNFTVSKVLILFLQLYELILTTLGCLYRKTLKLPFFLLI